MKNRIWYEDKNGFIRLSVTSDGTSGPDWAKRLHNQGFHLSQGSLYLLHSSAFKPTSGVTTEVAIVRRKRLPRGERSNRKVISMIGSDKFQKLNPEAACLLRKNLSNNDIKEMELWWIFTMHEPINDDRDDPRILIVGRGGIFQHRKGSMFAELYDLDACDEGGDGLAFDASYYGI